jgi:hypothetical protein
MILGVSFPVIIDDQASTNMDISLFVSIWVDMAPPRQPSTDNCGLALRIAPLQYENARNVLQCIEVEEAL